MSREEEIVSGWRNRAVRDSQMLRILKELHGGTEQDIAELLRSKGEEVKIPQKRQKRSGSYITWTPESLSNVAALRRSGASYTQIAKAMGVTESSARHAVHQSEKIKGVPPTWTVRERLRQTTAKAVLHF